MPLVLLLVLVQVLLLRQRIRQKSVFVYGIVVALAGMAVFNLGLTSGLVALGDQAGTNVPWAFSAHKETGAPALYPYALGITMTMVFAFVVGYGATVAEPALNAMGLTVPVLPDGAFYAWADCSAHASSSWDFVFDVMRQAHVALTPGRDFGRHGSERWVRLSYANAMPQLQEALSRLSHWLAART